MPISPEDAYAQTDPGATEEQRQEAASRIVAGVAANDAYWNSRTELEALIARSQGHGQVVRDNTEETPTGSLSPTEKASAIDSTAEELPPMGLATGASATDAEPAATVAGAEPPPATGELTDAEKLDKLRSQLEAAGKTPEV